jgi:hypothetical protein
MLRMSRLKWQSDADDSIRNDLEGRLHAKKSRVGVITLGPSGWSFTGPLPGFARAKSVEVLINR